jgi:hypothetical protein
VAEIDAVAYTAGHGPNPSRRHVRRSPRAPRP